MGLVGKKLAWDHGLSLLYLTTTTTKNQSEKKKSTDGRLARNWQDIEKYMHAVEDASEVLTMVDQIRPGSDAAPLMCRT